MPETPSVITLYVEHELAAKSYGQLNRYVTEHEQHGAFNGHLSRRQLEAAYVRLKYGDRIRAQWQAWKNEAQR